MRIMAVDYGDVRTGIAVSDASRTLAGEAWVVSGKKTDELAQIIANEAQNRDVSCIIVGYPKNMDGSAGARAQKSERFAGLLETLCTAEVKLRDERLTTIDAHRVLSDVGKRGKKRKQTVDAVAASLILESYLASEK